MYSSTIAHKLEKKNMSNRTQRRPLGQRTKPMSERSVSTRRVIPNKLDNKKVDEEIYISNQIKLEEDRKL
jgi:hypothetical protein